LPADLSLAEIVDEAAVLLNDATKITFTSAVILPFVVKAQRELVSRLQVAGVPVVADQSAILTIPANTTRIAFSGTAPVYPADLVMPLFIQERATGSPSTVRYTPLVKRMWDPDVQPEENLNYWTWREQEIKFPGATTVRDILINYIKTLPEISGGQNLAIYNAKTFMAARAAELVARHIAEDIKRADELKLDAFGELDTIISLATLGMQDTPVRRRPFKR